MLKAFLFHSYTHILDYSLANPAPVHVEFVPHRRAFRFAVSWCESLFDKLTPKFVRKLAQLRPHTGEVFVYRWHSTPKISPLVRGYSILGPLRAMIEVESGGISLIGKSIELGRRLNDSLTSMVAGIWLAALTGTFGTAQDGSGWQCIFWGQMWVHLKP